MPQSGPARSRRDFAQRAVLLGAGLLLPWAARPARAQGYDLTGVWSCDDGGTYYIRQAGPTVWWYGEQAPVQPVWSNVAEGGFDQSGRLHLQWMDVPKGGAGGGGDLYLVVDPSGTRMSWIGGGGAGFGGRQWQRAG